MTIIFYVDNITQELCKIVASNMHKVCDIEGCIWL